MHWAANWYQVTYCQVEYSYCSLTPIGNAVVSWALLHSAHCYQLVICWPLVLILMADAPCDQLVAASSSTGWQITRCVTNWWRADNNVDAALKTCRVTIRLQFMHHRLSDCAPCYHLVTCGYFVIFVIKLGFLDIYGLLTVRLKHYCTCFS